MTLSSETVVDVRGLVVRHGDLEAVRGINLTVHRGEVVGLIGPDGAGKTTTLRVIAGLARATAGAVGVLGQPAWEQRRSLHHVLGYLAQRFALYGDLTVDENVQFFALLYRVDDWRGRRDELLGRVGLRAFRGRHADRLSGGMRQKLALTCALIHSPQVLLLDEPTTGVDPVTRRELWRLLADLVGEGLTLVVTTPYLDEAERCSRVVLMDRGSVLADAPPASLPGLLPGTMIEVCAGPRQLVASALPALPGVADVAAFADRFHVRVEVPDDPSAAITAALRAAGATVEAVRVIPPGLEDTFLFLTRDRKAREAA